MRNAESENICMVYLRLKQWDSGVGNASWKCEELRFTLFLIQVLCEWIDVVLVYALLISGMLKPFSICAPSKNFSFKRKNCTFNSRIVSKESWACWHMLVIPALERLKLGDHKFRVSLDYEPLSQIVKPKQQRLVPEELNTQVHISTYIIVLSHI